MRHSHIAVRRALATLARAVNTVISAGEDDLGKYRYFDLIVEHENGDSQRIRFASHVGDQMVHVLAEKIDMVSDIAAALFVVGIGSKTALSISTDQYERPVRSADEILERIAAMAISSKAGPYNLAVVAGKNHNHVSPPKVAMH